MMTKSDALLLLISLKRQGVDSEEYINKVLTQTSEMVDNETINYINDNRQLDVKSFYEKLRKSYNLGSSKLYKNIVSEIEDVNEVLTTLSAYVTQVLLFSRKCEDKTLFLRCSNADKVIRALQVYLEEFDLSPCLTILRQLRSDIKCFERN